jgi:hypothetical protein
MGGEDRVALLGAERVERRAEKVVLHTEGDETHLWLLVLRNLPRRVERDRFPYGHDLLLGQAVSLEEGAGGVGPVDLEALVRGAVAHEQADVVEHCSDVEQLRVIAEAQLFRPNRSP